MYEVRLYQVITRGAYGLLVDVTDFWAGSDPSIALSAARLFAVVQCRETPGRQAELVERVEEQRGGQTVYVSKLLETFS